MSDGGPFLLPDHLNEAYSVVHHCMLRHSALLLGGQT